MNEECHRKKQRTDDEKKHLLKRLNIIEGQVRGISNMIEEDRYCNDVLIQISAVVNSLESLGKEVLKSHLSTCMVREVQNGNLEIIDEIMNLFGKLK